MDSSFFSLRMFSSYFQWNNLFVHKYYKERPDHALDYARWIYNNDNVLPSDFKILEMNSASSSITSYVRVHRKQFRKVFVASKP